MRLLVFEYSCVCLENSLLSEGFNMLKCILDDLDNSSFFDVDYLVNESIDDLDYVNLNKKTLDCDLFNWLETNSKCYDYALFIAPEDNLVLYRLTKILENNDVIILGCDSSSAYICSSKDLTYGKLSDNILKITSFKMSINELNYEIIKDKINKNEFIIKPDDKTSSELVYLIKDEKKFSEIIKKYRKENLKEVLIQEYIEGTPISVSMVCNKKENTLLSVNTQEINVKNNKIEYVGCKCPINHPMKKEIEELSNKIIKQIPGLKGFIGIDYIIKEEKIYFIEINSRITTPFIVLQRNCDKNLTENIICNIIKNKKINLRFKEGEFYK